MPEEFLTYPLLVKSEFLENDFERRDMFPAAPYYII